MVVGDRTPRCGIEALNVYGGIARIPVRRLFEGRGLDLGRLDNLMMDQRSIGLPFEDPVTNAVNAARPIVDRLGDRREAIQAVIACSESGVDYSKSIASYVHEHLRLGRNCRLLEVKQACYSATAALQLAAGYLASGYSTGGLVLLIATDVSLVDARAGYAEPAMGSGAAALLIGEDPRVLALDPGASGIYGYETMDSARPTPTFDVADADRSLFTYLDCLEQSYEDYVARVAEVDFVTSFDYLAMHTPFAGMVRAAHRKMMRKRARAAPHEIDEDFDRRVGPGLHYPRLVGNLCAGSVYLALASLIDRVRVSGGARVGLYSYGSGCASEFFSGLIDRESTAEVSAMRIGEHLEARCELQFDEYIELLPENLRCLVPEENREVDVGRYDHITSRVPRTSDLLVCQGTRRFHRSYAWLPMRPGGRRDEQRE
jgi:polyketide biosynthesis 3-hydroxy-3-methylglutaryl-CoA synthase-like enzyme PksG